MMLLFLFWSSLALLLYTYAGYHLVLAALARLARSSVSPVFPPDKVDADPTVTIVLAVYNEARAVGPRIENLLALNYPRERMEIIVASDGSTDATVAVARRYADHGVTVLDLTRQGKGPAQNQAVRMAQGDIVVFTDADTEFDGSFLRAVVRQFRQDSAVGCVVGRLSWRLDDSAAAQFRGLSWRLEAHLRALESRLGILASASGAAMALRRALWRPMRDALDDSDSVTPLDVVLQGYRVIVASDAKAVEVPFSSMKSLWRSKVRGVSKSIVMIPRRWGILNLLRHPLYSAALLSHHLLRWFGPYLLVLLLAAALALSRRGIVYQVAVLLGALAAMLVSLGLLADRWGRRIPLASECFSFAAVNAGFALGILKGLGGLACGTFETE